MANWIDDLAVDRGRIAAGTHHDPHGVLGLRERGGFATLLVYLPAARSASVDDRLELSRIPGSDFFQWQGPSGTLPHHYRICWHDSHDAPHERVDPYSFLPTFGARDLTAFSGGHEARA
jgi:1,4-alpha-glucan branching enzyme